MTPEAAEALKASGYDATVLDADTSEEILSDIPDFPTFMDVPGPDMSDGDTVDAEVVNEPPQPTLERDIEPAPRRRGPASNSRAKRRSKADEPTPPPREAKTGAPSLDEWTGFFSRVVLRTATDWYINYAFRGIDEDMLSEREVERIAMTDDERQLIAVPFAELSNKSKFMRKHGRSIVASGDAFNALVVIGAWASRVNRIAGKYRPKQPQRGRVQNLNGSSGQGTPEANGAYFGANGGRFPPGFNGGIVPGKG